MGFVQLQEGSIDFISYLFITASAPTLKTISSNLKYSNKISLNFFNIFKVWLTQDIHWYVGADA